MAGVKICYPTLDIKISRITSMHPRKYVMIGKNKSKKFEMVAKIDS